MITRDLDVTEVVSGCSYGADKLGERWAEENGISVKEFPGRWKKHGRRAGPIRNGQMAKYGNAAVVFWDGESRGSKNMIKQAREFGLRLWVIRFNPDVPFRVEEHRLRRRPRT